MDLFATRRKQNFKLLKYRKALVWNACHKLRKLWTSKILKAIKTRLFVSTVECVLLYISETWTLTKTLNKQLNRCYTKILRMTYNISRKEYLTNKSLYGKLPFISAKIQVRRMRLASHCARHTEEISNKLVLWELTDAIANRGRRQIHI